MTEIGAQDAAHLQMMFKEDGVVHVPKVFSQKDMQIVESAFDYRIANRSANRVDFKANGWSKGTNLTDLTNPKSWQSKEFQALLWDTPVADIALACCGGRNLWLYYEQVFLKEGESRRTPWHQDTSYVPLEGDNAVRLWITLDPLPRECQLEFIPGSHRGPLHNGSSFKGDDDTLPLYLNTKMPRLPDIEANRDAWNIQSFDVSPGDALLFHPSILHGGAPTRPGVRRRTLVLVFFGDDARFVRRPNTMAADGELAVSQAGRGDLMQARVVEEEGYERSEFASMKDGQPFRLPNLIQLRH
ncbi:MAG: phytanoyl-CoA dioxygenase family protein [Caulobacterales bacterium]